MRHVPWHPALFVATVVLDYWVDTAISPYPVFRSLLIGVLGAVVLTALLWAATGSRAKAGVLATVIVGLLYSKFLVQLLADLAERAPLLTAGWLLIFAVAAVLAARLVIRRSRTHWSFEQANVVLNWAAFVYLVATVGMAVVTGRAGDAIADLDQGVPLAQARDATPSGDAEPGAPDIFLILLDGYPRADVLADAFSIDNGPFVRALEERGFSVADRSRTDEIWTLQSLASMLHMTDVDEVAVFRDVVEERTPRQPALRRLVNDNPAFDLARERGYQVVAVGYEFEELALRQADVYLDPGFLNEFEYNLLMSTYVGDIVRVLVPDLASSEHRNWINYQVAALPEIAAVEGAAPRLVLGHIPAPHQPAVFGPNGEPRTVPMDDVFFADSPVERGEDPDAFAERYRGHLEHLNQLFIDMVDGILAESDEPPVIVLWGDHGSASRIDWNVTPGSAADPAALRERTATLFASYTPGQEGVFPDDIAPVDIFRLLADAYLGTELGRAPRPGDS
jgi:hypothetical protein